MPIVIEDDKIRRKLGIVRGTFQDWLGGRFKKYPVTIKLEAADTYVAGGFDVDLKQFGVKTPVLAIISSTNATLYITAIDPGNEKLILYNTGNGAEVTAGTTVGPLTVDATVIGV